jgi:hypothetical protein
MCLAQDGHVASTRVTACQTSADPVVPNFQEVLRQWRARENEGVVQSSNSVSGLPAEQQSISSLVNAVPCQAIAAGSFHESAASPAQGEGHVASKKSLAAVLSPLKRHRLAIARARSAPTWLVEDTITGFKSNPGLSLALEAWFGGAKSNSASTLALEG